MFCEFVDLKICFQFLEFIKIEEKLFYKLYLDIYMYVMIILYVYCGIDIVYYGIGVCVDIYIKV